MHMSLSMITALAIRSKTHERAHSDRWRASLPGGAADVDKPQAEGETGRQAGTGRLPDRDTSLAVTLRRTESAM
jgi:hypothetical protein